MTAFLDRIAFWRREPKPTSYGWMVGEAVRGYMDDFGPNVPVEEPCYYENGQPVYWEKAP